MMGFWSGLVSLASSAVSFVSNAVGSLGKELVSSTSTFLKVASPWLGAVVQVVQTIGILLDVVNKDDNIDELGAKAMQTDSKIPEDFDSNYSKYIDYLKNEVALDTQKFEKAGNTEKMVRSAVGANIVVKGVEEKKGFEIPTEVWVQMAKLNLADKAQEMDKILETFQDDKLEEFVDYTKGNLDEKKEVETGNVLVDMYKKLEPSCSIEEIENKVMKMEVGDK